MEFGLTRASTDNHDIVGEDHVPPLISFVVTNHNYGRFLQQCVDSIIAQDYPRLECIVVDDASTDQSQEVLAALAARYDGLVVVRNEKCVGQILSARTGFLRSRGLFVSFVDADDFLLPLYAKAHVHAHLSVPGAYAFSSCEMLEILDGSVHSLNVIDDSLKQSFSKPLDYGGGSRKSLPSLDPFPDQLLSLRAVDRKNIHWVWAPTTGTMYKRDAIEMFIHKKGVEKLKFNLDAYLNFALNALSGSFLIEVPLAAYRIHGQNNFAKTAQMRMVRAFEPQNDRGCFAAFCALEHMVDEFDTFDSRVHTPMHLRETMKTLARAAAAQPLKTDQLRAALRPWLKRYWQLRLKMMPKTRS